MGFAPELFKGGSNVPHTVIQLLNHSGGRRSCFYSGRISSRVRTRSASFGKGFAPIANLERTPYSFIPSGPFGSPGQQLG